MLLNSRIQADGARRRAQVVRDLEEIAAGGQRYSGFGEGVLARSNRR